MLNIIWIYWVTRNNSLNLEVVIMFKQSSNWVWSRSDQHDPPPIILKEGFFIPYKSNANGILFFFSNMSFSNVNWISIKISCGRLLIFFGCITYCNQKNPWYSLITLLDGKNKNVSIIPKWLKALHKSKIPPKKKWCYPCWFWKTVIIMTRIQTNKR